MITISLCMIVKDEEDVIERCLNSIHEVVDEIVIIDTGSKDNTIELVKKYTKKIYYFKWIDDFSKARDFSFSKATKDYILWLDADEFFNEDNRNKLLELKKNISNNIDAITMETYMCI
ncbi:MAG: glycosyltransferase family 2 protein, partial [Romboutsia sp.]|uniref:glycosyltransferase family 2 protein n=1 Tax=Romboutsia sp. TaxID=1965302 RepID=UPI003F3C8BB8